MKVLLAFTRSALAMPQPWPIWVTALVAVNGVVPWFYWNSLEARVIVGVFAVSVFVMMALFRRYGFVRLLGVGHMLWLGLVPWLAARGLAEGGDLGPFLWTVIAVNSVSLVFDITDVVRYVRGDREPSV